LRSSGKIEGNLFESEPVVRKPPSKEFADHLGRAAIGVDALQNKVEDEDRVVEDMGLHGHLTVSQKIQGVSQEGLPGLGFAFALQIKALFKRDCHQMGQLAG